jgi:hypothetical protein
MATDHLKTGVLNSRNVVYIKVGKAQLKEMQGIYEE